MTAISWILAGLGTWMVIIAALRLCAADAKAADSLQSEVIAAARRARFVNPEPRRSQVGG